MNTKSKIIFVLILFISLPAWAEKNFYTRPQSWHIRSIIKKEHSWKKKRDLAEIINFIDTTYTLFPENIRQGKKAVIFIDPAHGRLSDGRWQGGDATRRSSCQGLPEEYYSKIIARKFYNLLKDNKFIEVATTEDFLQVLQNKSEEYKNIPFTTTVSLARKAGAFIILAEHLNNVSIFHKAGGVINIPGIHVTFDKFGRRYLRHIPGMFMGFLTLYNKMDASGFSRIMALKLRRKLVANNLKPNNWDRGAVASDRFTYFTDFPVSAIYESGFISNPVEEKLLRDDAYTMTIAKAQYESLMDTVREVWGVDLETGKVYKKRRSMRRAIDQLKLARMAVYYMKHHDTRGAVRTINAMKGNRQQPYFISLKKKIYASERYYRLGRYYAKKRWRKSSRRNFLRAYKTVKEFPVLNAYRNKYLSYLYHGKREYDPLPPAAKPLVAQMKTPHRAPITRPIILPLPEGIGLKEALGNALGDNQEIIDRLYNSLKVFKSTKKIKSSYWSRKRKKRIYYWKKIRKRIGFRKGIYIITLNRNMKIRSVKRKGTVRLNASQYQNQQYLKNSHFASETKEKAL